MTSPMSSTSASSSAPLMVNGMISGINTSSVISALLESYQIPITNLQDQQKSLNSEASDYQAINTDLQSLQSAANALNMNNTWNLATATSSDSSVASATASPGAINGSLSFTVNQLAQANMLVSTDGAASTGTVVTSSPTLFLATGGAALGFSSFSGTSALGVGSHSIQVTQSSSAATVAGSGPLGASSTISSANNALSLTVGSNTYNLTLTSGTYSPSGLVSAINAAASSAGAGVTASLTSSGALQLATTDQGSGASLTVNSATTAPLGLTAGATATGTNAVVSVDGTATTLSLIQPGGAVTLNTPSGTISATVASAPGASGSLVSAGTANAAVVSTGNGSLSSVVSAIAGSGLGVTAQAVEQNSGSYLLQVGATATGLAGSVSLDTSGLTSGVLGSMATVAQAQDAQVSVGSGSAGYQLSSSTDTFKNLLQGTAVTVSGTGQATVTVSPDASGEASKVSALVSAANQVLADIQKYAGYNEQTKTGGPLMGSSVLTNLQNTILSAFASAAGTSGLANGQALGITVGSKGTLSFDQTTFEQKYAANPSQVAALFTQGGTFAPSSSGSPGEVSFVYAGTQTQPGSYDVTVSHSATQATDTGATLSGGATTAAENLTITQGSATAKYAVSSGESLSAVAAGLNAAFGSQQLSLTAEVINNGTQLQITSNDYGSAATFSVSSSSTAAGTTGLGGGTANSPASFAGTDVVGTINGVAATGSGQVLAAPTSDPTLQGLSVLVNASNITSSTDLGSFTYAPGLAQQLAAITDQAANVTSGAITTTIQGLQQEATGLNGQITNYQNMESQQQTVLQNEFAKMEATLGNLKSESSSLASSIAQLPGF
ncbi:MAG: flagellar filament capping protein FliD [Actinomycetota bacterium]|nr:flagellar filament capping protein FliD [Actinomycetota bacterium]